MRLSRQIILALVYACASISCVAQNIRFEMPLKGLNGREYFICRYVDHDTSDYILDAYCGTMTYNGHRGTDFLLRSFNTMDSGVYVYAVSDGCVFEVKDGYYDRMKTLNRHAQPNSIGIIHKSKLCTYYYHLMKNSLMVKFGDSVKAGQPIGRVGSSGYSTSPHLHFEVVDSNKNVVDPFISDCSHDTQPLWNAQPSYDTSLYLIEDGFVPYIPNLDSLQERYLVTDTFDIKTDTIVCHWLLIHGLRRGNKITSQWFGPNGRLWSSTSFVWEGNEAYAYSWPYIKAPKFKGKWVANFFVNDRLISKRTFFMKK